MPARNEHQKVYEFNLSIHGVSISKVVFLAFGRGGGTVGPEAAFAVRIYPYLKIEAFNTSRTSINNLIEAVIHT